jgi:hypothetical protein
MLPAAAEAYDFAMISGQHLDLTSPAPPPPAAATDGIAEAMRFLGVHFACCDAYSRMYINQAKTCYVGHCPRCARRVQFRVGQGGTDARFFVVE